MPLYVVRWHAGPLPTTLLENLILLTCALYLLTLWRHHEPLPRRTPLDIPIVVFLVAGVIGIFVAPDHKAALGVFRAFLLEPIAIFYAGTAVLRSAADVKAILVAGAVSASVFSLIVVVTFVRVLAGGHLIPSFAPGALGINPNAVALYLEPIAAVALGFVLFAGSRTSRWTALTVLAFVLPALACTLSRGALLAGAVLAVVAVLSVRDLRLRLGLIGAAVVGALALSQLPFVATRLANQMNPHHSTLVLRFAIWSATFRMLRDHPLFGAGISGYQTVMAHYRTRNLFPEPYAHNIFLTTWSELGLLGLAAFTVIFFGLLWRAWRAWRSSVSEGAPYTPLLWGIFAAWVVFGVHGLFDSPYWKNDLSLEFWVLAALEVVAIHALRASAPVAQGRSA
ncbi:MAG TPA: O-antigen ligase family protein [Candidatus Acidoferrum sp.]|jgi:O-antigen ligase|nr:O-antigen ligase family protein [Candidatus Acidoferrum sp.]